jgi:hypothetical protein
MTRMLHDAKTSQGCKSVIGVDAIRLGQGGGSGNNTVADWELERRQLSFKSLGAIREALERGGVEFTNGKPPAVRLVGR